MNELRQIVGAAGVVDQADELVVYECDGMPLAKGWPTAVVFPTSTAQVSACVRTLARHGLPMVPRGSGTGLAGGAVVFGGGVVVCTSRMTGIESIDLANRVALVQAGVRNTALSDAVAAACARTSGGQRGRLLHFSPDPSSQRASTVGGNAATNAGGINTLKYGVTSNHILGLEVVLPDGGVLTTRPGGLCDGIGPDLPGLLCGSEGTLGIITRLWCRLVPKPRAFRTLYAVFPSTFDACQTVSDVIATGIVPTSMEMMDGAMIRVVEDAFHYGFPTEARALLLLEIDGVEQVLDDQIEQIVLLSRKNHAAELKRCADAAERAKLWSARKRAFGAIGRISHSYVTMDACVPRSLLPQVMEKINQIGETWGLKITSVFHAGDGNVHPILLFDESQPQQVQQTLRCAQEILEYCIGIGGTITGEHGVGIEKLHLMTRQFSPATIDAFQAVKDAFDPGHHCNDGKLIPSDTLHIELLHPVAPNTPGGAL
jgi:glycolate oxidase